MAVSVVVTGANGFVGARVCRALAARGVPVRAVVRRAGTAPLLDGVQEHVGDFTDPDRVAAALQQATALVTTVHPMASDEQTQRRIGVDGTARISRAAAAAGVERHVHVSTAAVYDRSPGVGDIAESSALVGDDAGAYAVTKRDADAALSDVAGTTRVLVRPPAILGSGHTSVWNTLRPAERRRDGHQRPDNPDRSFAWVHVEDLASLVADLAGARISDAVDPAAGPVPGGCTALNVASEPATSRDYVGTVCRALGVDPVWQDTPAWTGTIPADRARAWGWAPRIGLAAALAEVADDVCGRSGPDRR